MAVKTFLKAVMLMSITLVVLLFSGTAEGMIVYVDADADGANNGTSWENAYNYLQDALDAVGSVGGEVRVAQGKYRPDQGDEVTAGDRWAKFYVAKGVVVKGGYAGFGEADPDERDINKFETILSGDLAGNDVEVTNPRKLIDEPTRSENSILVVMGGYFQYTSSGQRAALDGFTVSGGNGQYSGGGIALDMSDTIVRDCTFRNNSSRYSGGALYLFSSSPVFIRCDFICNAAQNSGGGAYLDGCDTCRISCPEFEACRFINNWSGQNGGGLEIVGYTFADMTNSAIIGNATEGRGGGLYHNVYSSYYSDASLINLCTISGNSARGLGGAIYGRDSLVLTNCIVWDNQMLGSGVMVTYSDIEGGWPGAGNINIDPYFVEQGYWDQKGTPADANDDLWIEGDYHLLADSPCINAADPGYAARPDETDLDGGPRVVDGRLDMGAYEYQIILAAETKVVPHNISLSSKGKWITCYIWLPEGYDVSDIEPGSIRLEDQIQPPWLWFDENNQVAMVKFRRLDVQQILEEGDVELTVNGKLIDGTAFEAIVAVKVVGKK